MAAIRSLKNTENPYAELFKAEPEFSAQILQPLFAAIWEEKQLPDDWTEGAIVKIPKKGALSNCNNWRVIILFAVPSKMLAKLIISEALVQLLRQEQAGIRKGPGCEEQIFSLSSIIKQCTEWERQLHIKYVDFEKAAWSSS